MNYEVKTFKFICSYCKEVEFVRDVPFWERPKDWSQSLITDCGSTGYTDELDLCPKCQ
jgi:hypothetical protein